MPSHSPGRPAGDAAVLLREDRPAAAGVVRILTLNRPAKHNALNTVLARELLDALELAATDENVRALVLAGNGRSFCAGGDLAEFRDVSEPRPLLIRRARLLADVQSLLPRLPVPVVSAVHGAALGAGAALATSADMAIGAADLTLGYPELADGVVPALVMAGPVQHLDRKLAFEMITTGRRMDADDALAHGIVNRVVGAGQSLEAAIEVATTWAALDPQALRETKRLFYRQADLPAEAAIQAGLDVTAATWAPPRERTASANGHRVS